jgi:hypothetical protein
MPVGGGGAAVIFFGELEVFANQSTKPENNVNRVPDR